MKYSDLCKDARLRLFVLIASISDYLASLVVRFRDHLNGDVDQVLSSFSKFEARLDRARMIASSAAARELAAADRFDVLAFAAEKRADAHQATAERATRVQQRVSKLLD